ncbi:MAG TPA: RagB/SusD family nutrient uptake outer membrane protein [Saprospiraceae bacterium]|nr:RagB/SusD family nutrient uptake outer membrane protein [Saprospiraceae bacterium]
MKKYIYFLSSLLFISMIACDDFLELEPHSQSVVVDNTAGDSLYFNSASELEAALGGAYGDFKNEYFQLDYYVNGDAQSDDAYAGGDNPDNFQIDDYMLDAVNRNVSRDWAYLYSAIGKVNNIINNADDVTDPALTDSRKQEIIGEAAFIRAFMYFQLVQLWGDVPLQLLEVTSISADKLEEIYAQIFPARASAAEVYAQIISDLETALTRVRTTAPHKGFATTGAVNALLAKVYATREPHDWAKVSQYADAVIGGGYSLLPEYDQLWDNAVENSAESIFEINYEGGPSDGNWGVTIFRGKDWKKFNLPANDLIAAFTAENDNIRKNASIIFEDVSGLWSDARYPQNAYPFINKWRNFGGDGAQNYIFIRLADILLLKAEALNELGDANGAAAIVNQIRDRVNLAPTSANNQSIMRLAIEKERRLELAFEGIRWFDLKRTGRAIDVVNQAKGPDGNLVGYMLTEPHLLWPVPQAELDKNANLTQNPGY